MKSSHRSCSVLSSPFCSLSVLTLLCGLVASIRGQSGQTGQMTEPTAYLSLVGGGGGDNSDNPSRSGQGNGPMSLQVSGDQISAYLKTLQNVPDSIYKGAHLITHMDEGYGDEGGYGQESTTNQKSSQPTRNSYAQGYDSRGSYDGGNRGSGGSHDNRGSGYDNRGSGYDNRGSGYDNRGSDDGYYNYDQADGGYADEQETPSAPRKYDSYAYDYPEDEDRKESKAGTSRKTSAGRASGSADKYDKYEKSTPVKESYYTTPKTKKPRVSYAQDETANPKQRTADEMSNLRDVLGDLVKQIESIKSAQKSQSTQTTQAPSADVYYKATSSKDKDSSSSSSGASQYKPLPTDYLDYDYSRKQYPNMPSLPPYPLPFAIHQQASPSGAGSSGQDVLSVTTYQSSASPPKRTNGARGGGGSGGGDEKKIYMKANELLKMLTGTGIPPDAVLAQASTLKRTRAYPSLPYGQDHMASASGTVSAFAGGKGTGMPQLPVPGQYPYHPMYPPMGGTGFYPPYPYGPMPLMNYGPYHPLAKQKPCAQNSGGYSPFGAVPYK